MKKGSWSPATRFRVSLAVAGLIAALVVLIASRDDQVPPQSKGTAHQPVLLSPSSGPIYGISEPDVPLPGGAPITMEQATALLDECGCPPIASSGPVSDDLFEAAFVNDQGEVVIGFRNGMQVSYTPDSRSEDAFLSEVQDTIDGGFWDAELVPLRGTTAAAHAASDTGPASLIWIEGKDSIGMIGKGGQSLPELIEAAEGMPRAGS